MGKASSSKKVARAARTGGSVRPSSRRYLFPIAMGLIVVLGITLVVLARDQFSTSTAVRAGESPTVDEHWHSAYGIYICDSFLPPLPQEAANTDTTGLHTHGDGLMHLHPFTAGSAGRNATLAKWGQVSGVEFGSDSFALAGSETYRNGYDCAGQPSTVKVYVWPAADPAAEPVIYDRDFGDIRFSEDGQAITIAVVPDGTEVPRPPSVDSLNNLDPVTDSVITSPSIPVDPATAVDPNAVDPNAVDPTAASSTTSVAPSP